MDVLHSFLLIWLTVLPSFSWTNSCRKIPTFLNRLRDGVDITKLDLLPLNIAGNDGFRNPVFDFTCNSKTTKELNDIVYEIPDQVWNLANIPSGWLNSNIAIHKSFNSVKRSMAVNVDVDFMAGMFSGSSSYETIQDYITNSSKYIEEVTSYTSGYKVTMMPNYGLELDKVTKKFIENQLPSNLDRNSIEQYFNFIKIFGTHYFNQGKFGGLLRLVLATDQSYFQGRTDSTVESQASASFLNILKFGGGGSSVTRNVDEKFTLATTTTIRYYGGSTNLLANGEISLWQPTVSSDPWLFGGSLTEISGLICDKSKRESMKRAVQIYTDIAYLQEMFRIVRWHYTSGRWDKNKDVLNQYKRQVERLLQEKMPNHDKVTSLAKQIESAAIIPEWFKKTQLCYSWYADGDAGQCGGGAGSHLCAHPNSMTAYYRDDTDGRGGGCQMRWGIISNGFDDWFRNVKICYQWWPDGHDGQCGGGASRLLCAEVNSYTPYYRDDTDGRSGGCQMQWMLSIPSDAPLWMQNAQICFEWYPDGNAGQCGGGAQRRLCAPVNTYTNPYRDDSDRRGGGCQMRWGIIID